MIQVNQLNLKPGHSIGDIKTKTAKFIGRKEEEIRDFHIVKKSIDARRKPDIYFSYSVRFTIKDEASFLRKKKDSRIQYCEEKEYSFVADGTNTLPERPVIVGMGPAGLFCAYFLAKHGYKPIIFERGRDVDSRTGDVSNFWNGGSLKDDSNVQFGEGGAGTFSDGKLNTLIKDKDGRNNAVLKTFVECGAPENILYESKPHIGTDILRIVVKNMRKKIIEWGGEVNFETKVTDFIVENNVLTGVVANKKTIFASVVILAIGHSARDTFEVLYNKDIPMEAKAFAVGFRVQHPQKMINKELLGNDESEYFEAASYKVTAKTESRRGVYSFCMCPGGYVVNASSEQGHLAVNGMSYSGRDGVNANSAIIVSVNPDDYGANHPLSGIKFQRELEKRTFKAGEGKVPCQYYGDYKASVCNFRKEEFDIEVIPQIKGEFCFTDLTDILPEELNKAFVEGMEHFGKIVKGFNRPDAILSGVESRTSSPVRILRDDTLQSNIKGLYPCGEGAGYAGGITSAAMDGLRVAEKIASLYKPLD